MRTKAIKIFFLLLFISGLHACKGEQTHHFEKSTRSGKSEIHHDKYSFVISCGSGCSLNYSSKKVSSKNLSFEIRFRVKMYINQKLSEEYGEVYIIRYNTEGKVTQINKKNDAGGELHPDLTEELKKYVDFLLGKDGRNQNNHVRKSEKSNFKLIYNERINLNNVEYKTLDESIAGTEKFLCDKNKLRYIKLPQKSDIRLILVPMDCGDFPYRFYLLTIKNNSIISDIYAEGEWYEVGNETYKEKTFFTIDESFTIKVTKDIVEDGVVKRREHVRYQILDNGKLKIED